MNKVQLIKLVFEKIDADLKILRTAALASHEAATGPENKAENQYDTRGLEASYLATAQAKRVAELEVISVICRTTVPKDFQENEAIALTALVALEFKTKKSQVLILTQGAGITVTYEGVVIQVITATSPLGEALIGLKKGDIAEVEQGGVMREYSVLSVS